MAKKPNPLHDHPRSMSEPVKPDELIEDAGDMSPDPKSPAEKLRKLAEEKAKKPKGDDK